MYEYEKQHQSNGSEKIIQKKKKLEKEKCSRKNNDIFQSKPLSSISPSTRKITIKVPSNISEKSMGSEAIIQRTEATVQVNGRERGSGRRARGGTGGFNHAEQLAWGERAQNAVRNAIEKEANKLQRDRQPVLVEFEINSPVCRKCVRWFEGTFWNEIQEMRGEVVVYVTIGVIIRDNYYATTLDGPDTIWGNVAV